MTSLRDGRTGTTPTSTLLAQDLFHMVEIVAIVVVPCGDTGHGGGQTEGTAIYYLYIVADFLPFEHGAVTVGISSSVLTSRSVPSTYLISA